MLKVSGNALAAGKIETDVSRSIPAASVLPITIVASSPSQPHLPENFNSLRALLGRWVSVKFV